MKRFIYVCAFFLCLCSCSESKYIAEELERTQEIINDYPDSALHSLQAIVPGSIRKKSTKAHYGLLYSLALDKTGQTIDTDSMLRPAVNYFMRKGTNRQSSFLGIVWGAWNTAQIIIRKQPNHILKRWSIGI